MPQPGDGATHIIETPAGGKEQPGTETQPVALTPEGKVKIGEKELDPSEVVKLATDYENDKAWKKSNQEKSEELKRDREAFEAEREKDNARIERALKIDEFVEDNPLFIKLADRVMSGELKLDEVERMISEEIPGLDKDDPLAQRLLSSEKIIKELAGQVGELSKRLQEKAEADGEHRVYATIEGIKVKHEKYFKDPAIGERHRQQILARAIAQPDVPIAKLAEDYFDLLETTSKGEVKSYMDLKEEESNKLPNPSDISPPKPGVVLSVIDGSAHKAAASAMRGLFGRRK